MEATRQWNRYVTLRLFYLLFLAVMITHCDARKSIVLRELSYPKNQNMKHLKIFDLAKSLNMLVDVSMKDSSNAESFISSPLSLPPYDSLSPNSLPDNSNSPPYCVYPPPNQQSPSTTNPTPVDNNPTPTQNSPANPTGFTPSPSIPDASPSPPTFNPGPPQNGPSPPSYEPSPPSGDIPSPPSEGVPNPPSAGMPSPPSGDIPSPPSSNIPSPPEFVPSPVGFEPSPPIYEPPVVYPPPTTPPPRSSGVGGGRGTSGVWCVAKPSVPDPIIQEAMNYACGSGADCGPIQPNGPCFQPNTPLAHASYAFNSYWQRTKVAGGTCSFGGTAILVTVNPSSENCHFVSV